MRHGPLPLAPDAVVFDCDGPLVDTESCWSVVGAAVFAEHGHPFGPEQKALLVGRTVEAAAEVMAEYFGRPVAVASNGPRELVDVALESAGSAWYFEHSFAADEVPSPKPAPDLYLAACEALGAAPEDCVAFENSATGARAARAAGLFVAVVPSLPGTALPHDWMGAVLDDPGLLRRARGLPRRWTPR